MFDYQPLNYEIVKRIVIKEDKVYFQAAENDTRPLRYIYREEPVLTDIFQREGLRNLLEMVVRDVYLGRIHLRAGSMITRAIRRGLHVIGLERFQAIDEELAVGYLTGVSEKILLDPDYDPTYDVQTLEKSLSTNPKEE